MAVTYAGSIRGPWAAFVATALTGALIAAALGLSGALAPSAARPSVDPPTPTAPVSPPAARVDLVDTVLSSPEGVRARLSRDGLVLAWGHADGLIRVVDLAAGREHLLPGRGFAVVDLALAPGGQTLAARTRDGALILWRLGDDEPLVLRSKIGPAGCGACGTALVFGPDGDTLLTADGSGGVALLNPHTGARAEAWRAGRAPVQEAAYSDDGRLIATVDRLGGLRLWTNTGDALWTAAAPDGGPGKLAVSLDGRRLALSGTAGATLFDARSGKLLQRLEFTASAPVDLAFSADGSVLGLLGADGAVSLWDPSIGRRLRVAAPGESPLQAVRGMAGVPAVLGYGDWTYRVWRPV